MPAHALKTTIEGTLACLAALAGYALLCRAQVYGTTGDTHPNQVILNATALDAKGNPVTDLTNADFQISDNGKSQPTAFFKASGAAARTQGTGPAMMILFDLLNSDLGRRAYISNRLIRVLGTLETADSVYLYLLTNRGDLYPIRGLPQETTTPPAAAGHEASEAPWTRRIQPLVDQAMRAVNGLRPMDERDLGERASATFQMLGDLGQRFSELPGPKTILWITSGVPNWVEYPYGCQDAVFPDGSAGYLAAKCSSECRRPEIKCRDYTPFFQHFGQELSRADTVVYSVEVTGTGVVPTDERGMERDTLEQLADVTGGRLYPDGNVEKAVTEALQDVRARYQLAFDAPAPDGKYHKIRVACTRKGVRIETQKGYWASKPQPY